MLEYLEKQYAIVQERKKEEGALVVGAKAMMDDPPKLTFPLLPFQRESLAW